MCDFLNILSFLIVVSYHLKNTQQINAGRPLFNSCFIEIRWIVMRFCDYMYFTVIILHTCCVPSLRLAASPLIGSDL